MLNAKTGPTIQHVEAKRYYCGAIARSLRDEHRRAALGIGLDVHHELTMRFLQSSIRRACFADGKLATLWGVTGPMLATDGLVWLAVADFATQYPLKLVKETRRELDAVMRIKRKLSTVMLEADPASLRFAHALGFRPMPGGYEKLAGGLAIVMAYEKGST